MEEAVTTDNKRWFHQKQQQQSSNNQNHQKTYPLTKKKTENRTCHCAHYQHIKFKTCEFKVHVTIIC